MNIKELKTKTKAEILEEARNQKKRVILLIILLVIIGGYLIYNIIKEGGSSSTQLVTGVTCEANLRQCIENKTNMTSDQLREELCIKSSITQTIDSFFSRLFDLDYSWLLKLFIFLGIVYLIQIMFILAMDVIEVIMLVFVIIKRIYKWIMSRRDKKNEPRK